MATRDALTRIDNWRHFEVVAGRELGRAKRSGKSLALAYIDLDNFKLVNDNLGHQTGDALLVSVASVLKESVRTIDCIARLGGDEFIVFMPETEQEGARVVVERIRRKFEETLEEGHWSSTLKVGLVTFAAVPASIDEMIKTADDLMYRAKKDCKGSVAELIVHKKACS